MESIRQHPAEEILAGYLFGLLPDCEIEPVEEHMLVCHACLDAAEQLLAFVQSLRSTLKQAPQVRVAADQRYWKTKLSGVRRAPRLSDRSKIPPPAGCYPFSVLPHIGFDRESEKRQKAGRRKPFPFRQETSWLPPR